MSNTKRNRRRKKKQNGHRVKQQQPTNIPPIPDTPASPPTPNSEEVVTPPEKLICKLTDSIGGASDTTEELLEERSVTFQYVVPVGDVEHLGYPQEEQQNIVVLDGITGEEQLVVLKEHKSDCSKVIPRKKIRSSRGSYCSSDNSTCTDTATEEDVKIQRASSSRKPDPPTISKPIKETKTRSTRRILNSARTQQGQPLITSANDSPSNTLVFNNSSMIRDPGSIEKINLEKAIVKVINDKKGCSGDGCTKKVRIKCPGCDAMLYCSDKHRRLKAKNHAPFCNAYRIIDAPSSSSLGRHVITARDISARGEPMLSDESLLMLPCNPCRIDTIKFPANYCVVCFKVRKEENTELDEEDEVEEESCGSSMTRCCCYLPRCKDQRECDATALKQSPWLISKSMVPSHTAECIPLRNARELLPKTELNKNKAIYVDQSVVWLLRTLYMTSRFPNREETTTLLEMFKATAIAEKNPNVYVNESFQNKLMFFRKYLKMDESGLDEDLLYVLDCGLRKHGRNVGVNIVAFNATQQDDGSRSTRVTSFTDNNKYLRCFYPRLAYVYPSCTPNSIMMVSPNSYCATVYSLKPLKKGEVVTICLDERSLFWPTWKRRRHLQQEYAFTCKCKRCSSQSELDTYFYSFPCSNCPKKKKMWMSPINHLDQFSSWLCSGCGNKSNYLRAMDLLTRIEDEISDYLEDKDLFGLATWFEKVVDVRMLHWNHYMVFHGAIELFKVLWRVLISNDLGLIGKFNRTKGAEFLPSAECIIRLTGIFMPDGYMDDFVLPLRLASIIKLRDLTNKIRSSSHYDLPKLDNIVHSMYFRAEGLPNETPLFARPLSDPHQERCMKVLELKAMFNLCQATNTAEDSNKLKLFEAPSLFRFVQNFHTYQFEDGVMFIKKKGKYSSSPFRIFLQGNKVVQGKVSGGLFPWVLEV